MSVFVLNNRQNYIHPLIGPNNDPMSLLWQISVLQYFQTQFFENFKAVESVFTFKLDCVPWFNGFEQLFVCAIFLLVFHFMNFINCWGQWEDNVVLLDFRCVLLLIEVYLHHRVSKEKLLSPTGNRSDVLQLIVNKSVQIRFEFFID